jgi:DNA-binding FrmR family transcriptional regulator
MLSNAMAKKKTEPAQTERERLKLLNRVKRIRGQIAAVERALEAEDDCPDILMQLAAVRGGVNSLMAEVLEDHIRLHLPVKGATPEIAEDLIDLVRAYLK